MFSIETCSAQQQSCVPRIYPTAYRTIYRKPAVKFGLPEQYLLPITPKKGVHGGGLGPHPLTETLGFLIHAEVVRSKMVHTEHLVQMRKLSVVDAQRTHNSRFRSTPTAAAASGSIASEASIQAHSLFAAVRVATREVQPRCVPCRLPDNFYERLVVLRRGRNDRCPRQSWSVQVSRRVVPLVHDHAQVAERLHR